MWEILLEPVIKLNMNLSESRIHAILHHVGQMLSAETSTTLQFAVATKTLLEAHQIADRSVLSIRNVQHKRPVINSNAKILAEALVELMLCAKSEIIIQFVVVHRI